MAKPPPSGPHSDMKGADPDARAGVPNRDVSKGTAKEVRNAEKGSAGRPKNSGKLQPST